MAFYGKILFTCLVFASSQKIFSQTCPDPNLCANVPQNLSSKGLSVNSHLILFEVGDASNADSPIKNVVSQLKSAIGPGFSVGITQATGIFLAIDYSTHTWSIQGPGGQIQGTASQPIQVVISGDPGIMDGDKQGGCTSQFACSIQHNDGTSMTEAVTIINTKPLSELFNKANAPPTTGDLTKPLLDPANSDWLAGDIPHEFGHVDAALGDVKGVPAPGQTAMGPIRLAAKQLTQCDLVIAAAINGWPTPCPPPTISTIPVSPGPSGQDDGSDSDGGGGGGGGGDDGCYGVVDITQVTSSSTMEGTVLKTTQTTTYYYCDGSSISIVSTTYCDTQQWCYCY